MSTEPTSSSGLPGRSRPALSDLSRETTETDLWNLDDDLAERTVPQINYPPQPRKGLGAQPVEEPEENSPAQEELLRKRGRTPMASRPAQEAMSGRRGDQSDEIGDLEDIEEEDPDDGQSQDSGPEVELRVIPEPEPEPEPAPAPAEEAFETAPEPLPLAKDLKGERPSKQNQRRSDNVPPRTAGASLPRPHLNRREILGLAAFGFTLLLAAIWVLTRFFSSFAFKSDFIQVPDFPIKGEHITLDSSETYWREPVRDGPARDFARREVSLIPVLDLTLDPAGTTAGALLVIFRNSEGQPVGDSIRRSFANGRFDAGGNATISFPATDGFAAEGDFNAYRSGKGDAWMAEVFEGPTVDAPADLFKPLATIPVLPKLR